ncbi:glycosyl transferase family 2 [Solidesulfovibrio fructosivorans JJ]]|uniref:Glycosyl transferase family 2 n=1 Tax=Solidesulfovibrio fructosivorans JJ] TaxID=596151 RepID=E1K2J9_SOLFR|nr:glycosyltransferase [Solidesulfovibrio fructosivorans]EFL49164.1 glycosyl transferase family 2 [Solidesulfovibrio fructosivorans JJ]]
MDDPIVNFSIVTFNRLEMTKKCLFSLKKYTNIPHKVTVVDNCSTDGTREFLLKLREGGLIDNLFLLKKNMGVSCASNFGFDYSPAPLYMKLDNDMEILKNNWIVDIIDLWARNAKVAILGPKLGLGKPYFYSVRLESGDLVDVNKHNLPGAATIISRDVFQTLGYWNEDYGLYGEEDADYSHRAKLAKYLLVSYDSNALLNHLGTEQNTQIDYSDYKMEQRRKNLNPAKGINKFALYCYLYDKGLLSLYCPRRYVPVIRGDDVDFTVDQDFLVRKKFVAACAKTIAAIPPAGFNDTIHSDAFVARLQAMKDAMRVSDPGLRAQEPTSGNAL